MVANRKIRVSDYEHDADFPENATIRKEYVKCGKVDCECFTATAAAGRTAIPPIHGPYMYAYWKDKGKLKKKYIGKTWEDWLNRGMAKDAQLRPSDMRKIKYILELAEKKKKEDEEGKGVQDYDGGRHELIKEYVKKLEKDKVTVDWAYKKIKEKISDSRIWKMIAIAEEKQKGVEISSIEKLTNFIAYNEKQTRGQKIISIAKKKGGIDYHSGDSTKELTDFICSDMENEGFDPTKEEDIDSYLNSEFR